MMEACERAKIVPHYTFHELRHTYASLLARAGVPMKVIAQSLGHATTSMTEKHYAFLAPSHVADTIRKHLPKFGLKKSNVVGMR
jgi:integrase